MLAAIAAAALLPAMAFAADAPKELHIDWATYNPVSMLMKDKGLVEKEFAKDGITVRWVQTLGSNKALEFLNAGSIDFGSSAGAAALVAKINGNPIKSVYVYSKPEWTALVTSKDSPIKTVTDLKGKRVAVTRGTDPHIFLVRALQKFGMTEKDIVPVLLQHPDGKTALIRGDVEAWAGLDPDDGAGGIAGRRAAVLSRCRCQQLRYPQCAGRVPEKVSRDRAARAGGVRDRTEICGRPSR